MARAIKGVKPLSTLGRWEAKKVGALVGGTIGLSAAIADGNPDDIITKTAMGLGAGSTIGGAISNIPGNVSSGASKIKEDFMRGAMGDEAYNNAQFDKQIYKSSGYKKILSSSALNSKYSESQIKEFTQRFLDNGITDTGVIQKALEADVNGDEYKAVSDLGITDVKKYSSIRKANSNLGPSEIAARMLIAKNMPTEAYNDENFFVRYVKRYGIGAEDGKTLFNQIDKFA